MSYLKRSKPAKMKANRRNRQKRSGIAWRKLFHGTLRYGVMVSGGFMALIGGILAIEMVGTAECFRVKDVLVENNQRVDTETIIASSGVTEGHGIFGVDLAAIGRKIEEQPWIAVAEVTRHFPNEVVIRVEEREPRAIINLGYLYYVDGSGEVFKVLDRNDKLDYPVITGIDRDFLLNNPQESQQLLGNALRLIDALEKRAIFTLSDVSELHVNGEKGIELFTLIGGVPVRMGHNDYKEKLDRLERVYNEIQPRLTALKSIDLNVTDRVIVKITKTSGKVNG